MWDIRTPVTKFFSRRDPRSDGYVYGSAKLVTALLVVGILLYTLTNGWGTIIVLTLAVFVLLGRYMLERQAAGDFRDLRQAKQGFQSTRNREYLEFIEARGQQMLRDNKILTPTAKDEIRGLLDYAGKRNR